jgi:2-polyprenyl-3-methyl-5-hydroxy-6-metoxy-1,4-benzoquinol methylase
LELLDVGCGAGQLFKSVEGTVVRYVGIDTSPVAVGIARQEVSGPARFVIGDAPDTSLGTFDVVVCADVLYGVANPAGLLDAVVDRLCGGGHLISSTWRHRGDRAIFRLLDSRLERIDAVDVTHVARRASWRVLLHRKPP